MIGWGSIIIIIIIIILLLLLLPQINVFVNNVATIKLFRVRNITFFI